MGLLPWSFGFLIITSVLTWALIGRTTEETLLTGSLVETITKQSDVANEQISSKSITLFHTLCDQQGISYDEDEEGEGTVDPNQKNHSKRQKRLLTSKLHISALFSNTDLPQKATQETIFRNLTKTLYGSLPLFVPEGDNNPYIQEMFDEARAKALEITAQFPMKKVAYLANIPPVSTNTRSRVAFFLTFKGGRGEVFPGHPCVIPSLLDYVTIGARPTCISVYLAPVPTLMAIFDNADIVQEIVIRRHELFLRAQRQNKSEHLIEPSSQEDEPDILNTLSEEFKSHFESSLPSGIDPQYIDFRVSRTCPKNYPQNHGTTKKKP